MRYLLLTSALLVCISGACSGTDNELIEQCDPVPGDLLVPVQETGDLMPIHWSLEDGCISVFYDPWHADVRPFIDSALAAWEDVACSSLCFEEPVAVETAPERSLSAREIYIGRPEIATPATPETLGTTSDFVQSSGRILVSYIGIEPSVTLPRLVQYLGFALGLSFAPAGSDSVLAIDNGLDGIDTPSAADEATLCVLYGDEPLCTLAEYSAP